MLNYQSDPSIELKFRFLDLLNELNISKRLNGINFRKGELLGKGTIGHVYKVLDENQRAFARKEILHITEESLLKNVVNETKLHLDFQHKNIVNCIGYDYINQDDGPSLEFHIYFELADTTLEEKLKNDHRFFTSENIKNIVISILSACLYLGNKNISHRDIKPDNVLIFYGSDGSKAIKLADFGQAQINQYEIHQTDDKKSLMPAVPITDLTDSKTLINHGDYYKHDILSLGVVALRSASPEWGQFLNDKTFGISQIKRKIEEVTKNNYHSGVGVIISKIFSYCISTKNPNFRELYTVLKTECDIFFNFDLTKEENDLRDSIDVKLELHENYNLMNVSEISL